ncbi:histidine phosphatase family protein [Aquisalimonas sp. 2447]|uniref:histidine phosphatase family protein n=1 Tax=Aquisalimonas sp. 2447 TaxID=2740807 RepID=UPI0014325E42|nr:histidine phosphatase family protein [Aquisalimonas sp. 2447]QIT56054.1 histidine phosphatase family protein [Aquisalimonas sp. 2447]
MGEIHLIRHGQASFGSDDYDRLSDLGRQQTVALRDHWRQLGLRFDVIYCGLLHRQSSTANLLMSGELAPEWRQSACLDEFAHQPVLRAWWRRLGEQDPANMPDRELLNSDRRVFQRFYAQAMTAWLEGRLPPTEGLESWDGFRERCRGALSELMAEQPRGARIGVVTSAGVIGVLVGQVLGLRDEAAMRLGWTIYNTSLTRFVYNKSGDVSLLDFNSVPHLEDPERAEMITFR